MASFFNQATLSYNGNLINSNVTTGEIVETLSATKTAVTSTYGAGDTVTYVVNIVNSGAIPFTGLTVTDDLGAYPLGAGTVTPLTYRADSIRYFVNGALQAAPTVTDESPLTITGINVPADSNASIVYETTVNNFAPLAADSEITNTVTINGNSLTTPVTAEETINVEETPNLSVFKTLTPTSVTENGTVTYTITIQNTGNTAAAASSNLYITDTFNPALSNISVTLNGAPLSVPSYTYNEATGVFTTAANVISIPAATYTQNPTTGAWTVTPGTAVITVTGTI
ncbi:MAG: hypothetical protein K2K34_04330 [Oscillospiraceae bacterium]|nr:hypothetical protein [Oscillospiraceae bacterium]